MRRAPQKTFLLHDQVLPALKARGFHYALNLLLPCPLIGRRLRADVLGWAPNGKVIPIFLCWRSSGGSDEETIVFKALAIAEAAAEWAVPQHGIGCQETGCGAVLLQDSWRALVPYLVLGGGGWTLRDFYIGGGLQKHLTYAHLVRITDLESFVSLANQGRL